MTQAKDRKNHQIRIKSGSIWVACAMICCGLQLSSNAAADTIDLRCTGYGKAMSFVSIDERTKTVRWRSVTTGKDGSEMVLTSEFMDGGSADTLMKLSGPSKQDEEKIQSLLNSMFKSLRGMRQFVHVDTDVVTFGFVTEGREFPNTLDRHSGTLKSASLGITQTCTTYKLQ
jgi:hypothetical protein